MLSAQEKRKNLIEGFWNTRLAPIVMGVVNVTPDSFSDGGRFFHTEKAVEHALRMFDDGAQIVDIGGESTRPCAKPVDVEEELRRVIPVIERLAHKTEMPISVDTRKSLVAKTAIETGAIMVNDVSGFTFDEGMIQVLVDYKPIAVAMHMRGTPQDMQSRVKYENLIEDIKRELMERVDRAVRAGFPKENILIDPGIGFAKTYKQCLEILKNLEAFCSLGFPVLVGPSRKSFVGVVLNKERPEDRLFGTAAAVAIAVMNGARVIRVHDVPQMVDVVRMAHALKFAGDDR
jgi:dihydropteroate synthase